MQCEVSMLTLASCAADRTLTAAMTWQRDEQSSTPIVLPCATHNVVLPAAAHTQNRIAEFHTELEVVPQQVLASNEVAQVSCGVCWMHTAGVLGSASREDSHDSLLLLLLLHLTVHRNCRGYIARCTLL